MIRNILVAGTGGVGGYFGSLLARASGGRHITFIARGEHLKVIREKGLTLDTDEEKGLHCRPDLATDDPSEAPVPDLCVITVKGYDLDDISRKLSAYGGDHTVFLPLLNGVDIRERIRRHISTGVVLPACVYVSSSITAPGRVRQIGPAGSVVAGRDPARPEYDITEVQTLFADAHIPFSTPVDPYPDIWQKFLFIASYGLVTAAGRKNFGELLADAELVKTTEAIISETAAVGRAAGVALPEDAENIAMAAGKKFPPETRTSFQRDIEAGKRKNEGDLFGGTILRMGQKYGVPTPVTEQVYRKI